MTDALPAEPLISVAETRIRTTLVHDQLRRAGLRHALPCDAMFMRGVLVKMHWQALHLFRADLMELPAKTRKDGRGALPADARPRKGTGFSMSPVPIERAKACPRKMSEGLYEVALILVGEAQGEVERAEAQSAAREVWEIYEGSAGTQRWREWG
jgi:hypothetical protein